MYLYVCTAIISTYIGDFKPLNTKAGLLMYNGTSNVNYSKHHIQNLMNVLLECIKLG